MENRNKRNTHGGMVVKGMLIFVAAAVVALGRVDSTYAQAVEKETTPAGAKIPVILDTDIGCEIDDQWALMFMLKCPQLDVKLVTTENGNVNNRCELISKFLTAVGRTDVPIGKGAASGNNAQWQLDATPLGPWAKKYPGKIYEDGVQAMIDTIHASKQTITVIGIGPLQTLALALKRDPTIAAKSVFSSMQGRINRQEYNVCVNIPSAQQVDRAPWQRVSIAPADTCGCILMAGPRIQCLRDSGNAWVKLLYVFDPDRIGGNTSTSPLWDTEAVYLALPGPHPLLVMNELQVYIADDGTFKVDPSGAKMSVATKWRDLNGYLDYLLKTLLIEAPPVLATAGPEGQPAIKEQTPFMYSVQDGKAKIVAYNGTGGAVTIPEAIGGSPVTSIGRRAFYNCTGLTGVNIPKTVTEIGDYAFAWCAGLTDVTIPDSVTRIGNEAFFHCHGLTHVTLSANVATIGNAAFALCTNLPSITIPDHVTCIGRWAFSGCPITDIAIPDSVTNIEDAAFENCAKLAKVKIGNQVTRIGESAFLGCPLDTITIARSVAEIGNHAITSAKKILVEAQNASFSSVDGVLFNKDQTRLIRYPAERAGTHYTIPGSVTCINEKAFKNCHYLTGLTIHDKITSIGDGAFGECQNLTSITIPASVTDFGDRVFDHCRFHPIAIYFKGNAPKLGPKNTLGAKDATVYYLPEATGWSATFGGSPTAVLKP